jgi:phosphate transport system substrate-binding protein
LELHLFGAGTASGTFDFFTEAVVGRAKSSRTDYTPTEDDNVTVQGVVNNAGGMGYFGIAYLEQNRQRLRAISVDGGAGPIAPSAETVADGSYPLSRPLFVYFSGDALRRPAVRQFAIYYLENAARLAPVVGYVPLPDDAYAAYVTRVREITTGTAFGGVQDIGASIEEVLARPLVSSAAEPQE